MAQRFLRPPAHPDLFGEGGEEVAGAPASRPRCLHFIAYKFDKIRDLCLTSPGLVFPTRRVDYSSRRVDEARRRLVGSGKKYKVRAGWRVGEYAVKPLSIRNLFPKKRFTYSPTTCFLLISMTFECEGLTVSTLFKGSPMFHPTAQVFTVFW